MESIQASESSRDTFGEAERLNFVNLSSSLGEGQLAMESVEANKQLDKEVTKSIEERQERPECASYISPSYYKFESNCKYEYPQFNFSSMNSLRPSQHWQSASWASPTIVMHAQQQQHHQLPVPISYMPLIYSPDCMLSTQAWPSYQGFLCNPAPLVPHPEQLYHYSQGFAISNAPPSILAATMQPQLNEADFRVPARYRGLSSSQSSGYNQRECQYFKSVSGCRFGDRCRFLHTDPASELTRCNLNQMGLPLRPDRPLCAYYRRYGVCKYGPTCRFHHPMEEVLKHFTAPRTNSDGLPASGNCCSTGSQNTLKD